MNLLNRLMPRSRSSRQESERDQRESAGNGSEADTKTCSVATAAPLFPGSDNGDHGRVVLLILLGLEQSTVAEAIEQFANSGDEDQPQTVFFVDVDDFGPLRTKGVVFEHAASAGSRQDAPKGLDWDRYLVRRLQHLQDKWRPTANIPLGIKAKEILAAWRVTMSLLADVGDEPHLRHGENNQGLKA